VTAGLASCPTTTGMHGNAAVAIAHPAPCNSLRRVISFSIFVALLSRYCSVASHTSFNAQTTRRILEFVRFPSRASPQAPVCSQHTIVQAHQEFVVGEDAAMLTKSPFVRHVQ